MTIQTSDLRFELRRALQRSIGDALDEVLKLPHQFTAKHWKREDLQRTIDGCQAAIGIVRFFVTEFTELVESEYLDQWSIDSIAYAERISEQLEEEVIFVQAELLLFAR